MPAFAGMTVFARTSKAESHRIQRLAGPAGPRHTLKILPMTRSFRSRIALVALPSTSLGHGGAAQRVSSPVTVAVHASTPGQVIVSTMVKLMSVSEAVPFPVPVCVPPGQSAGP